MLKPVAAVGGALALAGAGAIGSISLMENFVIAGVNGVEACDENPVGQVGPFKSTLDFSCTVDSTVLTGTRKTVSDTYASFAASPALESVPTSEFWPLFPARNFFGIKPLLEAGSAALLASTGSLATAEASFAQLAQLCGAGQCNEAQAAQLVSLQSGLGATYILAAPFESCEQTYTETVTELQGPVGIATLATIVGTSLAGEQENIAASNDELAAATAQLGGVNYFGKALCEAVAQGVLGDLTLAAAGAECATVVDFAAPQKLLLDPTNGPTVKALREATHGEDDTKSFVEVAKVWLETLTLIDAQKATLGALLAAEPLAQICEPVGFQGAQAALAAGQITYEDIPFDTDACKTAFNSNAAAIAALKETVSAAVVDGITGVPVSDLTDPVQIGQLLAKCNDQEEDLAAIEQAQILLPGGAAAAGVAALLLFVAVATAKAPLVLAGGFTGIVGGVVTLVALLGVRNAPVYANVGEEVAAGEIEYKAGLGSTLGLIGIGAPVVGGLLGVGSFFCGSDEAGNELSSKVDNTY